MIAQPDVDTLIERMESAKLPCASVQTLDEALHGEFAKERELLVKVDDRRGGERPLVRSPYRFSKSEMRIPRPAPTLGEHNVEVLAELLGYNAEKVRELERAGILINDPALHEDSPRAPAD